MLMRMLKSGSKSVTYIELSTNEGGKSVAKTLQLHLTSASAVMTRLPNRYQYL